MTSTPLNMWVFKMFQKSFLKHFWFKLVYSSDMNHPSDKQLLQDFLKGDLNAFEPIVKEYSTSVYRLAWKFTRDRANAEDITQETFIKTYESLRKNPKMISLKAWLMTVCVNQCRNLAKKKRTFSFSSLKKVEGEDWETWIPDSEKNPKERLETKTEVERVQIAIDQLPEKYQIVLQLRYTEDLSYKEIAAILSLPINTVKVHLKRAKEKLKILLDEK